MHKRLSFRLSPVLIAGLLIACGPPPTENATEAAGRDASSAAAQAELDRDTPAVLAAYVLLVPDPSGARALARAIVSGTNCPKLSSDAGSLSMIMRDNPHGFAVNVCEQYVAFGTQYSIKRWSALPVASRSPRHPLIVGDSGCHHSKCEGGPAKPFDKLAKEAAKRKPDLVVHVGDFNYRGTGGYSYQGNPEYDAGDVSEGPPEQCQLESPYVSQNASYSQQKDNWDNWRLDFFEPAAPLLAAAPWVVTRGNHELCSRAGPGWFFFLSPTTQLGGGTQQSCPAQDLSGAPPPTAHEHIVLPIPGTVALTTLRVAVMDSANACDEFAPGFTTAKYAAQFASVFAAVPASPPTWLVTHRPIFGARNGGTARTLESAIATVEIPTGLSLFVSGHMHLFQTVTFEPGAGRPPQLVVGNSGVSLSGTSSSGPATVDGQPAEVLTISEHGFVDFTSYDPTSGAWTADMVGHHDGSAKLYARCSSAAPGGSICKAQ